MTDDTLQPIAIPWYRSAVLRGILAAVAAQLLERVRVHYHLDLTAFGVNANAVADMVLDAVSAAAVSYAAHARVSQSHAPVIVATKAKAAELNEPLQLPTVSPAPPAPTGEKAP